MIHPLSPLYEIDNLDQPRMLPQQRPLTLQLHVPPVVAVDAACLAFQGIPTIKTLAVNVFSSLDNSLTSYFGCPQ